MDLQRVFGDDFVFDAVGMEPGSPFQRFKVVHHYGSTSCKFALRRLPLESADVALILSEFGVGESLDHSVLQADSRALTSVITLRTQLPKDIGKKKCKVVTELMHPKSNLVVDGNNAIRRTGSFVYSSALETGVFALAAEDKMVYNILMELLDPNAGGHIVVIPVRSFVHGVETLSYYDLNARVMQRTNGVLLGWRCCGQHYPDINPNNKAALTEWRDSGEDELLVLCPCTHKDSESLREVASSVALLPCRGIEKRSVADSLELCSASKATASARRDCRLDTREGMPVLSTRCCLWS
jgi:hypothetical protein